MRILVIDDDVRLAAIIVRLLKEEQHSTDVVYDGEAGLQKLLAGEYDIAIVDWMLPLRDGPSICKAVRVVKPHLAMLMLTARGQVEDRIHGLDSGADDYLAKPFSFAELLARVRALSRRFITADCYTEPALAVNETRLGELVLDHPRHIARYKDSILELTATEWNLLELLMRHPEQVLSRQQILDHVWPYDQDVQQTMVDLYISYLRRKLAACEADGAKTIETVRGFGYRLRR